MRKVGIIGLGHVGATVAFTLFTHGIADELVLIDKNPKKAQAEFNDLSDTLARNDFHVKLKAQDFSDLRDLDVLITAFGNIKASVESGDRFAEFGFNSDAAKEVGQQIKDSGFHGIIINVANPCDAPVGEVIESRPHRYAVRVRLAVLDIPLTSADKP